MNIAKSVPISRGIGASKCSRYAHDGTRSLYSGASNVRQQKENLMDRESMNPTSTEHSKTGGGDEQAAHDSEAFNPKTTDPGTEVGKSNEKSSDASESPLNMSGARDAAKQEQGQTDGSVKTSEGAAGRKSSQPGSARKHGTGNSSGKAPS